MADITYLYKLICKGLKIPKTYRTPLRKVKSLFALQNKCFEKRYGRK